MQLLTRKNSEDHVKRWEQVQQEVETRGTYDLTYDEIVAGARLAWRNAPRCIGRIQWANLKVNAKSFFKNCKSIKLYSGVRRASHPDGERNVRCSAGAHQIRNEQWQPPFGHNRLPTKNRPEKRFSSLELAIDPLRWLRQRGRKRHWRPQLRRIHTSNFNLKY